MPSTRNLLHWLRAMAGRRIGVLGDFMLDAYVWGHARRLSPEAAVPVVDFAGESHAAGGAGNVAANLAALGARVVAFGVSGTDPEAQRLHAALTGAGVDARGVLQDSSRPTTLKTRIIARHQQIVRVDRESRAPISPALEKRMIARVAAALHAARGAAGLDALVISDYDKGLVTEELVRRVLALCAKLAVPVAVKPKWSMLATYPGATAIVLNAAEASFLVTQPVEEDESAQSAGAKLLEKFKSSAVVLTRGARGMMVFEAGRPRGFSIPARGQEISFGHRQAPQRGGQPGSRAGLEVFDLTGAGDTVLATVGLAVAAGAPIREAAILGNAAAGIVVTKLGAATVSPAELAALLRSL